MPATQLNLFEDVASSEAGIVRLAIELGATTVGGPLAEPERRLLSQDGGQRSPTSGTLDELREQIRSGEDPLGDLLCRLRPAAERRLTGAFYTPAVILQPMVEWLLAQGPDRVVDPGCGTGRFAAEVARRRPGIPVVAVDIDPVATLCTRAALAVLGARNPSVRLADYTTLRLHRAEGRTGFIGNPPYVRHHDLPAQAKEWAARQAARLGHEFSGLAGLHAYFYLATALHSRAGDVGCFVTSAEWLDVSYGSIIRDLMLDGLGGRSLHVVHPEAVPFDDAMTTACIACFTVGDKADELSLSLVRSPEELRGLQSGVMVQRAALASASRWTPLLKGVPGTTPEVTTRLRDVARVHRGVATGANGFFVMTKEQARGLGIARWCRPAITRAREVLAAGGVLHDGPERRVLLDVPADIDRSAFPELDAYLSYGESSAGGGPPVAAGYLARSRKPWWRLGVPAPPPVIASYMARQAPAFALNPDRLVLLNVAHGIYPIKPMGATLLVALVEYLNDARCGFTGRGRTYHGGLEKFEPREMEELPLPPDGAWLG